MWNKIFFRNTEQAKYAKYTIIFSAFFALFLTTVSVSHAQSTSESEKNTDQNARIILQNSIHALQTSQNYAVDLHCRAQIFGIFFSGKGMYCQKRQRNTFTAKERISSRWEMEYYFPTFHQYNLSVLNGEQMKLWRFNERRTIVGMDAPNTSTHPKSSASDLEQIDLGKVSRTVSMNPTQYKSLPEPWYTQPHIDQLLQGILDSYHFTVAGVTQTSDSERNIYLRGILKSSMVEKILQSRSISVPKDVKTATFSEKAPILSFLPSEIPTYVEVWLHQTQGVPRLIRFSQINSSEKGVKSATPEFHFSISFENTYLNNATLNSSFFEIPTSSVTRDSTETFLETFQHSSSQK